MIRSARLPACARATARLAEAPEARRRQPSVWAAGAILAAVSAALLLASPPALPADKGASGLWQQLQKLQTTASALHTTAHPDDEHGGMLAMLSRRDGVRVSLLTLTRGEAGDNAIGPQLFDGLGLIRTEELLDADAYYGVSNQYFTTVADYGFSKRLDEALEKWGRLNVLRDVVRVIRMDRPFVLISRFQGNARDGHGNHSTAGLITQEAFKAAGDPQMFPEQIRDGLRPWQPFKVYIGGVRENENWTLRVDPGEYSPWLGDSYANFARLGLSFQRSQNSGRYAPQFGPAPAYYLRVGTTLSNAPDKESSFFDGIDTTISGLFRTLGETPLPGGDATLQQIDRAVKDAVAAFNVSNPSACVPALAAGLKATRLAITAATPTPDSILVLKVKEQQFEDAINTALGVELTAFANVRSAPVPGQSFEIVTEFANRGPLVVGADSPRIVAPRGWSVRDTSGRVGTLPPGTVSSLRSTVTLDDNVALSTRPYFTRASLSENHYSIADELQFGRPASASPAVAVADYGIGNGADQVHVSIRAIVRRREPKLPYGDALRELRVVPALALTLGPGVAIVPLSAETKQITVNVDLLNNTDGANTGTLKLQLPAGWTSAPAAHDFSFARAGERRAYRFTVSIPAIEDKPYSIEGVATSGGREYREGYDLIDERDLELTYLYKPARVMVRGVAVSVPAALQVGYVMGIGDQVPAGIAQLGHTVTLLNERELASGNLQRFDAIVTGTRAYAVRDDLVTYNQRLLDYVKGGGNLVVLYNTAELVPSKFAPYPGELTPQAEEVSEEDSPVTILAPGDPAFTWPNRITKADFDGWVEQRGSKFWSTWAPEYTPMIETQDQGQPPQKGGWLSARYGSGRYTYFAYAFHRQLPYGVPGAYRLLENVLALGRAPGR